MARRSDHSREELHELILESARKIAEKEGLRGLSARRIARDIGYTIGTIYNFFTNLDDVIVHMNGRTLDTLYKYLITIPLEGEPEDRLISIAERYIKFVSDHPKLWSVLFEHHLPEPHSNPDWYYEKIARLRDLIEEALAPLFPPGAEMDRLQSARILWSSVHGICTLAVTEKLAASASVTVMTKSLIKDYLAGLRGRLAIAPAA